MDNCSNLIHILLFDIIKESLCSYAVDFLPTKEILMTKNYVEGNNYSKWSFNFLCELGDIDDEILRDKIRDLQGYFVTNKFSVEDVFNLLSLDNKAGKKIYNYLFQLDKD